MLPVLRVIPRWLSFLLLAASSCGALSGAVPPRYSGAPIAQVFTEREIPGSPQTRSVLVHPNGLVYVGNTEGLVEYDGATWRVIEGTRGLIVHNVAASPSGRIWYSATGEFGWLTPDSSGTLVAHPLHRRLHPEDQAVGHVLRMLVHGENAYFVTQGPRSFVARANASGEVETLAIPIHERAINVFPHENAVHAITTAAAYRIDGTTLIPVPEAHVLAPLGVQSLWPRQDGGSWVVSAGGLRIWRGSDAPLVSSEVATLLDRDQVTCGTPLADGTFALGTGYHGLLIVDPASGQVLARYDDDGRLGAASSTIVALATDTAGGLWLSRFAGVTRIQAHSPAALHEHRDGGVPGRVQAFVFHEGRLHVASTHGVFVRDEESGRFDLLPDAVGDMWVLLSTEEGLIVGGPDLRLLRSDGSVEIIERERLLFRSALRLRRDPDRLVASTGPGMLRIYRRTGGRWEFESVVPGVRASLFPLIEDADGWLWATRNRLEVVRLDWRQGVRLDARLQSIGPAQGLSLPDPERARVWIFLLDGALEVSSWQGLWRHDPRGDRFTPETRIKGLDTSRWSRAFPLSDGAIWFAGTTVNDPAAMARRTGPGSWQLEPAAWSGLESIRPLEAIDDPAHGTLWLGYVGLASLQLGWNGERVPPPAVRLRSISVRPGQLLWGGAGPLPVQPEWPPANTVHFTFAAPHLQPNAHASAKTEYRTRLLGLAREWSEWSSSTHRDFHLLPAGTFTLQLQARDGTGRVGPEATFSFVVLPPWWQTWWARSIYAIAGLAALAGIVGLRTRTLRARAARLQSIVAERTEALSRQNDELARLHKLELDEKITAKLVAEKSRLETLRYQLNPHFLFNSLTSIRSQIPPGLVRARDSIDRLADFCRKTLRDDDDERVTLGDEFAMLQSYLDIERFRLGELLTVSIELDLTAAPVLIPRLLLLPLVENALKYGAATSADRVELRISARRESEGLLIEVANTGRWIEEPATRQVPSFGIGHENLRERLNRYFPNGHEFTHHASDGWVRVVLRLQRSALIRHRN